MKHFVLLVLFFTSTLTAQGAAHFSGGMCASQGSWLQDALAQSRQIITALETLRDDPSCKVLVAALEQAPKVNAVAGNVDDDSQKSFVNTYRELSALNDYMNPARLGNGVDGKEFQRVVFDVVFNKSYSSLKDLNNQADLKQFSEDQRQSVRNVSIRLKSFLDRTQQVANITMATTRGILNAMPASKACLHNNPSAGATIFGAVAHSSAALVSGGQMNGVGEFIGSLMNFSREMSYAGTLKGLELEAFKNSVSCLVESTSESYCAIQDAEDAMAALKRAGSQNGYALKTILASSANDPVASPLAGLVIYMRDLPIVQQWLQHVLLGMSPNTSLQGQGKNDNWDAYLGFVKSVNSLQGNFRDKEQQYYANSAGKDRLTKLGLVREIFFDTLEVLRGDRRGTVNFYTRARQDEEIPFFLLGLPLPADFNGQTKNFSSFWLAYSRDGINGFDNPDRLLQTVRDNLWKLMALARVEANDLFTGRMLEDSLDLVTEAMKGPGISPYQGFLDQRSYFNNLITKINNSVKVMENDSNQAMRRNMLRAHVPLLKDSVARLDAVINALQAVGNIEVGGGNPTALQSEKIMNAIFEAGNMLVSWDNFFGARMKTALQADLSDTLWQKSPITDRQREYLLSVGPDIVQKLSGYFTNDPVSEHTDLNAAKSTHIANLGAVEEQFAKVLFNEILALDCKLEGGYACDSMTFGKTYDPTSNGLFGNDAIRTLNSGLAGSRKGGGSSYFQRFLKWWYKPTDDATALVQVRAKYCVQALAFKSRDAFAEVCRGAVLESDFSDRDDAMGLNLKFDDQLTKIGKVATGSASDKIDRARGLGVCSFRSYLRKNHIFFMYRDYNSEN